MCIGRQRDLVAQRGRGPAGRVDAELRLQTGDDQPPDAALIQQPTVRIHRIDDRETLPVEVEMAFDERQNAPANGAKAN